MVNMLITAVTAAAVLGTASATVTKPAQASVDKFFARSVANIKTNKAKLEERAKVSNQSQGRPALRGLKKGGKGKGKGDTVLFRYFSGACEVAIEADAKVLGVCAKGLDAEGHTVSRKVTSNSPGEPLSLVLSWYEGEKCKGDVLFSYDLAEGLPPHDGKTYGDCITFDGGSFQIEYVEGSIEGLDFDALVKGYGSSYDDCADNDLVEYTAIGNDLCFNDDESATSFKYVVDGCGAGGTFYKYEYSDLGCTSLAQVVTHNEADEVCRFDFNWVNAIYEDDEVDIIPYGTTFCNNVD